MYKRSILLINPKFQIKFCLFVCSLVFLPSLIYPFIIYDLFNSLASQAQSAETIARLSVQKKEIIIGLGVIQVVFTTIVFIGCIFMSHKIAGPMFKLNKFLKQIRDKGCVIPGKLFFRKGDNFLEIAEQFNLTFAAIQDQHNKDFAYISEINSFINNLSLAVPEDKKAVLVEITSKLTEIQDRFKEH